MSVRRGFAYILFLLLSLCAVGQTISGTHIVGYVRDSLSRDPVPLVTISLMGADMELMGSELGGFSVDTDQDIAAIRLSAMGYRTKDVVLNPGQTVVVVDLVPAAIELAEVEVKKKKEKYSKKNNPAVELQQRIRLHMDRQNPFRNDYYSFEKYERLKYGFNDVTELTDKNVLFRKYAILGDYADTSQVTGKRVLPISVKEQIAQEYFSRSPKSHKTLVQGVKSSGIDESMDQASVKRYLDDVFREVDIFGNDVTILSNRFVSPLSNIAADFYKFYLSDTLDVEGERCVELSFVPHTPETFGFLGRVYVVMSDSACFIKKVKLNVPHRINLNYVERVYIEQDYAKAPDGSRIKMRDDMEVDFRLVKGTPGLFARRETSYRNHSMQQPADLTLFSKRGEQIVSPDAEYMPDEYWRDNRPAGTNSGENTVKQMLARLR